MASYQDLAVRVAVLEEKIDFTMRAFAVQRSEPSKIIGGGMTVVSKSLLDLYRELKAGGEAPVYASEQPVGEEVV